MQANECDVIVLGMIGEAGTHQELRWEIPMNSEHCGWYHDIGRTINDAKEFRSLTVDELEILSNTGHREDL